MMFSKKGVSPVIATVLLIVITLIAIGILAAFVVPFVKKGLGNQDCFNVIGHLKFEDSPYVCYVDGSPGRTGFSVRVDDASVVGFKAVFYAKGSSEPAQIINSTDGTTLNPEIHMLGNSTTLVLPQKGGVRTYVAHGVYEKLELYPVLISGTTCDQSDSIKDINKCLNPAIISELQGA